MAMVGSRSGIVRIAWMDFGGWWDVAAFAGVRGGGWYFVDLWGSGTGVYDMEYRNGGLQWSIE